MKDLTGSDIEFKGYTTYEELSKANVPIKAFTKIEKNDTEDNKAPAITKVSIESTNSNSGYATLGDIISLTINTDEELEVLPTVKIAGMDCEVEKEDSNQYKASMKVSSLQIQEGEATISISGYKDKAGNQGETLTNTTDNSKVIVDVTVPSVKLVNSKLEDEAIIITLDVTDENIKDVNLTENSIIVKSNDKEIEIEVKEIVSQKEIKNGKEYVIKFKGMPEKGKVDLVIESGVATDYAGQKNANTNIHVSITEEIISNIYNIVENRISKIEEQTKISEFFKNIQNSTNSKIFDKNNNEIKDQTTIVKTGMKLKNDIKEYIIVVRGDTNGDGKITSTDLSQIKSHLVEIKSLQDVYEEAGDMNGDGKITSTDLSQMKKYMVGLK